MAALTVDVIVDRLRSICAGPVFEFGEAVSWSSFDLQPTTNLDGVFRIPPPSSQSSEDWFDYAESRTDSVEIWVARKRNNDYNTVRRQLMQDVHSLTAAVIRDGLEANGDYGVMDSGRGHSIQDQPKADYVTLRLTLPVNYDAQW